MGETKLANRIVSDPEICGGRPRIEGTRITGIDLLTALAAGDTIDELLEDFPYLSREDFSAALLYAADLVPSHGIAAE
jgi:uncharacterized protein (DUF433 family)